MLHYPHPQSSLSYVPTDEKSYFNDHYQDQFLSELQISYFIDRRKEKQAAKYMLAL